MKITTTKTCVNEVFRHSNQANGRFGIAGLSPDERRRTKGAAKILPYLQGNDDCIGGTPSENLTIKSVFCGVSGLSHESGGGEKSLVELLTQSTDSVELVAMMDSGRNNAFYERGGRELVKESVPDWSNQGISFVSPAPILALLAIQEILNTAVVCSDIARLIQAEGWPVTAWHDVPLDCSQGPDFLPVLSGALSD